MRRLALVLLALFTLVPAAQGGGAPSLLAIEWRLSGDLRLQWRDPLSLKAFGPAIRIAPTSHLVATSPDRRKVVSVGQNTLRIVDLRRMKASAIIYTGYEGVEAALWTEHDVVAVGGNRLYVVDPSGPRMKAIRELPGQIVASARAGRELALLLGPKRKLGRLTLALVDGSGGLRTLPLAVWGGRGEQRKPETVLDFRVPGFAVDAARSRAIVVPAAGYVIEVDLRSLRATTRALARRTPQKTIEGWFRNALWLDATHLAVTGVDYHGTGHESTPSGLQLIDISDWSVRTLADDVMLVHKLGSTLFAYGRGTGIGAYAPDGRLRFRALADEHIRDLQVGPTFLYVSDSPNRTRFRVLEPSTGRVVASARTARPTNILAALP